MQVDATNPTIVCINQDDFNHKQVLHSKLSIGARNGFFYVEIPSQLDDLVQEAVKFANSFAQNPQIPKQGALRYRRHVS